MRDDYRKMFEEGSVGMAEIQGRRKEQEDWLTAAVKDVAKFSHLSASDRAAALTETFSMLQARHGTSPSGGSTANATIAWLDKSNNVQAATANLGDSTSFLVVLDENNNLVSCRLMHQLHTPDPEVNKSEAERVKKQVDRFNDQFAGESLLAHPFKEGGDSWRLGSGLAMTRSLGDKSSEIFGLSHAAEISVTTEKLPAGHKAFIVVACDGLTELSVDDKVQVSLEDIGNEVAKGIQDSVSTAMIAHNLVNKAYHAGSHDNISVAVFEVATAPTSAAIFDGHDGKNVSFAAGKDFYPVLTKVIEEKLLQAQAEDTFSERSDLASTINDDKLGESVLSIEDEEDLGINDSGRDMQPDKKKPQYTEENLRFTVIKNSKPAPTEKDIKVIEEIRLRTDKYMLEVNTAIVKNLLNSNLRDHFLNQFMDKNSPESDYEISNRKWSKLILERYPKKLQAVINDKNLKMLDNKQAGTTLKSLALQHEYGAKLQNALKHSHPKDCMDAARAIFKDAKIRKQLEKGHGFWGKIFQWLGLTAGKRLGRFFDAKDKEIVKSRRVSEPGKKQSKKK